MNSQPEYFNATELLKSVNPPRSIKISQFLDTDHLQNTLQTLTDYKISERGRGGYTMLRVELKEEFEKWLGAIGKGRGRKAASKTSQEGV